MRTGRTHLLIATAVAAGLAAAPLAQARDWHHGYGRHYYYHRHHGNPAAAAIIGGIIGLGVGAAIAGSEAPPPAYYAPPPDYYGAPPGYYYAPPPPAIYYGCGYKRLCLAPFG